MNIPIKSSFARVIDLFFTNVIELFLSNSKTLASRIDAGESFRVLFTRRKLNKSPAATSDDIWRFNILFSREKVNKFRDLRSGQVASAGLSVLTIGLLIFFCYLCGLPLVIPLLLLFGGMHLFYNKKASVRLFLNLGFLLTCCVFMAHSLLQYTNIPSFYFPVASVGMLTILLFNDLQLAFVMSLLSSIIVGLMVGSDLNLILIFLIGNLTGVYSIKDARTRLDLIKAGFFVGVMQMVCIVLLISDINFILSWDFSYHYLRPLFINGLVCFMVVMFTSKIFEWLFGVLTNFSLLEMADTNHPLLKRLAIEAPGTYHHSLIVSNIAESAADAIGANPLLTRVGAYYHDIGKMIKPEYFTENQLGVGNKHDNLEPSMSRLVILNHVKEGIELAQKYKLNPLIIDFIPQHHGTALIHYFYQRALEEGADKQEVSEENFRYPGPKPQTREAAVVMLADSVEGASRALEDHNPAKIDEMVHKIINNKFIDGQLDECNLTLKEIEQISRTFTRILSTMYHSRVKYPDKRNPNDHNSRKSPETNPSKTAGNPPGRKKNSAS